ncbi:putative dehydrogenase [Kineosphaera limosa]|uniref:Putative oxidoreductase n=1 Tax=Kineosphaera limosa NBRC 100340 TaxID=1184609 RepID=K6WD82_9MICO|nr:Gfo/Idh/MocA family oxidoreductase [Kineosphaera limosa]NYE01090.1 putative dehydrogenase [Kineosphaera limosa]GAB97235.1 putative oxidoreductase [Kineosphaera limosa NBRC 100340]
MTGAANSTGTGTGTGVGPTVVRWGMLSTSGIGRVLAAAAAGVPNAQIVAVGGRDAARARAYADELGIERSHGSYEQLLADPDVDAVYVPVPISLHTEWTIRALRAGKHVLCEKPFATSAADAAACFEAAQQADRVVLEGLMGRRHPQTALARRLLADGAIGRLAFIRAALTVDVPPGDIRRTGALGGGALLDLGCYCVSAIRLFGGRPVRVAAARVLDEAPGADGGDLRLAATLQLPAGVLAQFDVALDYPRRDELELIGTAGTITLPDPWLCRAGVVRLERDGVTQELPADPDGRFGLSTDAENEDAYRLELQHACALIAGDADETDEFGAADAIEQAATLEAVHAAAVSGAWVDLPTVRL